MTLPEAYEKLRREAIVLRRENAKLKEGTYVNAEKAAHLKEISRLQWENKDLSRKEKRYHELWQAAVKRNSGPSIEDLMIMDDLRTENSSLKEELASVKEQLQNALDIIRKLTAQMNRDHENSSIPSSGERFPKKIKNSRIKTDRKPGGQPGHPGHKRPHMEPTKPVINIPVPDAILSDPDYYLTGKIISKQVVDIEVNVSVTQYSTPEYRNRRTGARGHAPFPAGVANEFNYGEGTKALAFLLNNYCNVSIDKTSEFIRYLSDDRIILSKGFINDLGRQFSMNTAKDRERIFQRLLMAPVMYSDITPGRVNGKTVQVFVCANEDELLYLFREHKGHEGIKGTPVEQYQQTLVHDHDRTFYHYGGQHQECLAHVLRYLQDSIENESHLTWNKDMKDLLTEIIHQAKENKNLFSDDEIKEFEKKYDRILYDGFREYEKYPPSRYYPDGLNLCKRLSQYKENHLLFLKQPGIQYTNNLSERDLRKFKRKQRQAVTFRSNSNVNYLCDCMSIIETYRRYDANIFQISKNAFAMT